MRERGTRGTNGVRGALIAVVAALAAAMATPAGAACCVCRDCAGAAFCVDALANALACSSFCVAAGCPSTVFDSTDSCTGGCDGAPEAPTATASPTPSDTPTASPTLTPTTTATATDTLTPTETATATITPTPELSFTPTASPTATATASPTGPPQLSGRITYYTGDGPVPDAEILMVGDTPGSATSDGGGDYGFATAGPGNLSLQPRKAGQFNAAVTALDASFILQTIAGLRTLTAEQRLAADVTGNGSVTTIDAVRILQLQAELLSHFAAADLCGSDWLFVPVPAPTPNQSVVPPQITAGVCQMGRITFSPFTPPLGERNFRAILLGDVSGNWQP